MLLGNLLLRLGICFYQNLSLPIANHAVKTVPTPLQKQNGFFTNSKLRRSGYGLVIRQPILQADL